MLNVTLQDLANVTYYIQVSLKDLVYIYSHKFLVFSISRHKA